MGEWLLRFSAWLSLLGWAASEWERVRAVIGSSAERRARLLFTFGGVALVVHSIVALHVRYAWSQEAALRDTAQQTLAVTGMAVGAGLFGRGPLRWIGAAALVAVLAAWYRGAGARADHG